MSEFNEGQGILMILSGPSGSGKGTVVSRIVKERSDTVLSVSATTRAPRPGERDGIDYFFYSREKFLRLIDAGEFLEYAEYNGEYYGTPAAPIKEWLNKGKHVLLEIEVQGAEKVMDSGTDNVSLFLTVPSFCELERRLRKRGTETEESIKRRLEAAKNELTRTFRYDYIVLNDELDAAAHKIHSIIDAESVRYPRMKKYISTIK